MHKSFKENRKAKRLSRLRAGGLDPCMSDNVAQLFSPFPAAQWKGPCGQEGSFLLFSCFLP